MKQQYKIVVTLAGILAVSLALAVSGFVPGTSGPESEKSVDCDTQYDRTTAGEMESSKITDKCRPLPESVKDRVLMRALSG